jgi:ATP-dependent DNA helicase RecG
MSATPIPRTIGLSGCGLLDVTKLESEPRRVQTTITTSDNLNKIISVLQNKIDNGSKCFWVLPRIGENTALDDDLETNHDSVLGRHKMLTEELGDNRVAFVHGKMNIKTREETLAQFADPASSVNILVSTTVIEVGIDVKDVDYLIVENAERFGKHVNFSLSRNQI